MRPLSRAFWLIVALGFLFEAWLWDHLEPLAAWLVDRLAWRTLKARVAAWVVHLPPYPTLLVFLVPVALLFPLKLLGVWMLANGSWVGAMTILIFAKLVGMGFTALIFDVTRDKLLRIGWFRLVYERVMAWRNWAHAIVDPIRRANRQWIAQRMEFARHRLRQFAWLARPRRAGRFARRLLHIRRRMHAAVPPRARAPAA
ncbi:MAG: hypothetical protein HY056_04705 [Proteobacteria bacterium]|nr:hypothetical protein [Pseudomonadota bacterium]